MGLLKVPENGLQLLGGQDSALPPQAFFLSLRDSVIADMIKEVEAGGTIKLQLGSAPAFHFGGNPHRISPEPSKPTDLFLTKPFESTRKASRLPNTSSLFDQLAGAQGKRASAVETAKTAVPIKQDLRTSSKSSTSSGIDSDLEALKDNLAAHDARRERTHIVNKMPNKGRPMAMNKKLLSGYGNAPRSLPTSPALNGISSPSAAPGLSASQQLMERAREQRSPLVHELAVKDQTEDELLSLWPGEDEDFKKHLEKCAEFKADSNKWALKTMYWKELNVWQYKYESQVDRQMAIDNAIQKYDRGRMDTTDPLWEKLLPKDQRGTGIVLSRLQARLDKGPATAAPKIKLQKADDSSNSRDDGDASDAKSSSETKSKSKPGVLPKTKKPTAQELQTKRLLHPNKARPVVSKAPPKPAPKVSPTKGKGTGRANDGRVLSQEIIEDSDSSSDGAVVVKTKIPPKPAPKPAPAPFAKETGALKRPAPKETLQPRPTKRPRSEKDDDSTSSSEAPLALRLPSKPLRPVKPLKQRRVESNSQSTGMKSVPSSTQQPKPKNTSPIKSSPLASSPPTNASELENEPRAIKKRKAEDDGQIKTVKRHATRDLPSDVMNRAQKFKAFYRKYELLHNEISAQRNPPDQKVKALLDMRARLEDMKKEIYKRYQSIPA